MMKNITDKVYDVCIIGSGPAGIITSLEYSKLNPSQSVLLIEYGKKHCAIKNNLDDSINVTNTVNHSSPYESTNKGFGGTSASWGGRCVMYDEIDFVNRSIINSECTWDVNLFHDVSKYLAETAAYFECGNPQFNLKNIPVEQVRIAEGFIEGEVTDSLVERWSKPTRFGKRYNTEIKKSENITLRKGMRPGILVSQAWLVQFLLYLLKI